MAKLKRSQLVEAAKELNETIGLEPAIPTKPGTKNEKLESLLKEAGEVIESGDEITAKTQDVLKNVGVKLPEGVVELGEGGGAEQEQGGEEEAQSEEQPEEEAGEAEAGEAEEAPEQEEEEQEEPEPEPEPEPEKPAKGKKKDKAKPAKEKAFKGPGVIKTIASLVEQAGKKGITKEEILEGLQDAFPDRDADAMRKTINVQVPNRITKEKFPVGKKEGGRYFKEGK